MTEFEDRIRELTVPRGGAYPRPWTTDSDPSKADVLIVGASSAKTFAARDVGSHDQFLNALWNRNGQTCRAMYAAAVATPSRTRPNLDRLAEMLALSGLTSLQTNVSCASAPYDADLSAEDRAHGTLIFKAVVAHVPWKAMIVHGVGASERFGSEFGLTMPPVPQPASEPVWKVLGGRPVYIAPTLAPPSYRSSVWPYLESVVLAIAGRKGGANTSETKPTTASPFERHPVDRILNASPTSSEGQAAPPAFNASAANLLVWRGMQEIQATTGLSLEVSGKQASLNGRLDRSSTTRVFRHQFATAKPELLVRDDVFRFDPSLRNAADWSTHTNPTFQKIRTDDLALLNRMLEAVKAFARDHQH